jgi:hypothetical protein
MIRKIMLAILVIGLTGLVWGIDFEDFNVKESENIVKEVAFDGGTDGRHFEIDNIFGALKITGYNGNTVKVKIKKTIKAETKNDLTKAKKEVKLDITSRANHVLLYVDGPFRDKDCCHGKHRRPTYIVEYDFEVQVPHKTGLTLRTVTNGDIDVTGINGTCKISHANGKVSVRELNGDFDVKTANGAITLDTVAGSGSARTANGKVAVRFTKNPFSECNFKTINGDVSIEFPAGLSADFKLKTSHGKMYSDFPSTYLPGKIGKGVRKNGKYVYKSHGYQNIRIGSGGPSITMNTMTGDVIIAKAKK